MKSSSDIVSQLKLVTYKLGLGSTWNVYAVLEAMMSLHNIAYARIIELDPLRALSLEQNWGKGTDIVGDEDEV